MYDGHQFPLDPTGGGGGSVVYSRSKGIIRAWNRLSRFQRNLIYMAFAAVALVGIFHVHIWKPQSSTSSFRRGDVISSLRQLVEKTKIEINKRNVRNDTSLKNDDIARNRVEAVRQALRDSAVIESFNVDAADQSVDKNEDKAAEDEDEEGLPPRDGSLKFGGPTNDRQRAVVKAFKHAWTNYRRFAWGQDHLRPISKSGHNWFGLGLTIVDSLDTLLVMKLDDEFAEASRWVENELTFDDKNKDVNLFETTIRVLGGLLSAHHLTADPMFLTKARQLGNRLMGAFRTPSGIPYSDVNLLQAKGRSPNWSPDSSTSEVTTIQLEFRDLSRCTKDDRYEQAVDAISKKIYRLHKPDGLVPIFISPTTGKFQKAATVTLGARGDSYYEYLLKQWLQKGKTENYFKLDFLASVQGIVNRLVKRTVPNGLLFVGELLSGRTFKPKMDELVCFLPGALALASYHGLSASGRLPPVAKGIDPTQQPDVLPQLAEELAYTCYLTFARQPTFLAPELSYFNYQRSAAPNRSSTNEDFFVKPNDAHYLLRPETIESLWYLYYVTGNRTYQDWGWNIFQGIEKYTKVSHGYTTVGNVRNRLDLRPKDMMESFFLAETLKYLYLLFSDRHEIDLKRWLFNTEAHLLPMYPH